LPTLKPNPPAPFPAREGGVINIIKSNFLFKSNKNSPLSLQDRGWGRGHRGFCLYHETAMGGLSHPY